MKPLPGSLLPRLCAGLLAWPGFIWAAPPVDDTLGLSCPVCHGSGEAQGNIPSLAGLDAAGIERSLREFRDGGRAGTAMPRLVKALDDAALQRLAAQYGSAPP